MDNYTSQSLIGVAADYTLRYGVAKSMESYRYDNGLGGSNSASVESDGKITDLKKNNFEIILYNMHIRRTSGIFSKLLSEVDEQIIQIYLEKKLILVANKFLGGTEKQRATIGMASETKTLAPNKHWKIQNAESLDSDVEKLIAITNSLS